MDKKILLLGDSITESFPNDFLIPGYAVLNKGISGNSTNEVLQRLDEDVIQERPDIIFMLIGTNDFARNRENIEISDNYTKILFKLKNSLPSVTIYAVSVLPVRDLDNRSNARIIELNNSISKLVKEMHLNFFDLYSDFTDEEGKLKKEFTEDGLHLTAVAYLCWKKHLLKLLSRTE